MVRNAGQVQPPDVAPGERPSSLRGTGEVRFRHLVESAGAILWEAVQGSLTYISPRVASITGHPDDAFTRDPGLWDEIVHSEDRESVAALRRRASEELIGYDREYRVDTADGRLVWLHDVVTVDATGPTLYGVTVDVDAAKREERRLQAQVRTATALGDAESLADALPAILEAAAETGGWDAAALYSVVPLAQVLRCVDVWTPPLADAPSLRGAARRSLLDPGQGAVGRAWSTRLPVWLADLASSDDPIVRAAGADGFSCGAAVPLLGAGQQAGVLLVFAREPRQRDDDLLRIGAGIGSQLAVFIDRQRIEQERAFDRALLASQNEATIDATYVVAPDGTIMSHNRRFVELWEVSDRALEARTDEAVTAEMVAQVVDPTRFLEARAQLYADPEAHGRDEVTLLDGRIIDRWSAPLRHVEAAITYGRAWYFRDVTEERRAERHARFLADVTTLLSSSLAYEENITELARLAVPTLADWCVIDLIDEDDGVRRVAIEHGDAEKVAAARAMRKDVREPLDPSAARGVHRVIRTGTPELSSDIDDAWLVEAARGDDAVLGALRAFGLRSYLCVPLSARGRLLGVMSLVTAESGRRYDERDLTFARDLAGRAALLLDNLRLYGERDRIARTLQESLLPSGLPEIPGLELAAHYAAAGEAFDVGGDFYDVFSMGRRTWGVVIGDVCGKGPDAAGITALARNTVRVAAMQARKPKKILGLLNQAIHQQFDGSRFATVTFARVQPGPDGVAVLVCRGGHPPSLILRADGSVTSLRGPGTLIGAFPDASLADVPCHLGPGDTLLLYTDGIIEARNGDDAYGEDGLQRALARCGARSAAACVEAIVSEVLAFSAGPPRDDIAVLAIRVRDDAPAAAEASVP